MDESELKLLKAQRRDPQSSDVRGVLRFLSERGISAWVHGGWAVEGLVGKPLSHQDVDLFVPLEQRQRLEETLGDRLVVRDKSHVVWNHNFVQIDIVFFLTYKKNSVIATYRDILWVFPDPRVTNASVLLDGGKIPIVHPALILAEQEHTVRKKKRSIPKMLERAALLRAVLSPDEIAISRKLWPRVNSRWNRLLRRVGLL
ncbi:MAG: nucleotidyltransferase domain-containing protein [Candidatus Sumerlaeaceae bacterium]